MKTDKNQINKCLFALKRQCIEIYVSGFFLCASSSPVADPVVFDANVDFFSPKDIQYFQYNKGSIRKFLQFVFI
jgi:hypothetical protein